MMRMRPVCKVGGDRNRAICACRLGRAGSACAVPKSLSGDSCIRTGEGPLTLHDWGKHAITRGPLPSDSCLAPARLLPHTPLTPCPICYDMSEGHRSSSASVAGRGHTCPVTSRGRATIQHERTPSYGQ